MLTLGAVSKEPVTIKSIRACLADARDIRLAIAAVRAKPDSRYCRPGVWRVSCCPSTGMVVVERAKRRVEAVR